VRKVFVFFVRWVYLRVALEFKNRVRLDVRVFTIESGGHRATSQGFTLDLNKIDVLKRLIARSEATAKPFAPLEERPGLSFLEPTKFFRRRR
jgi:hypothetical protein